MRRLLILGFGLALGAAALAQAPAVAEPAQELVLRDLQGEPVALRSLRGRIVVLNFWATWCTPCRAEMPMLTRLQAEYGASGVTVVGASTDDAATQPRVAPFLRRYGVDFPIWMGATTAEMQRFGLGTALPATAVLDAEGNIVGRIVGPLEEDDLRRRLEWLLGDRSGPAPEAFVDNIAKAQREHEEETGHRHGSVALEGASSVPS